MDDSIRGMGNEGTMRSLWALMEPLRFVGDTILNIKTGGSSSDESESAVYFECKLLLWIDPWMPSSLMHTHSIWHSSPRLPLPSPDGHEDTTTHCGSCHHRGSRIPPPSTVCYVCYVTTGKLLLHYSFQGCGRFWLAVILGISTQTGLVVGLSKLNPDVCSLVTF